MLVLGLGQHAAGDDGVGLAVAAAAQAAGLEAEALGDPLGLLDRLGGCGPLVIVDAVAGLTPGLVRWLEERDLAAVVRVSSHGVGLAEALALARHLAAGEDATAEVRILGIGIGPPPAPGSGTGLSPAVAAAIPVAVDAIRRLLLPATRR